MAVVAATMASLVAPAGATAAPPPSVVAPQHKDSSWIVFQGWGSSSRRVAWREGNRHQRNVIGDPLEIARVDSDGKLEDHLHVAKDLQTAMRTRGIIRREALVSEQVAPADVLLQTPAGVRYAVVTRPSTLALGILRRDAGGDYRLVRRLGLPAPFRQLQVEAYASPDRRLIAIIAHLGEGLAKTPYLLIVPADELGDPPLPRARGASDDADGGTGAASEAEGESAEGGGGTASSPPAKLPPRWLLPDHELCLRVRGARLHPVAMPPRSTRP